MPKRSDGLKPLSFVDYFKIRETAKQQHTPEELIGIDVQLHDQDKLTYRQAYDLLSKMLSDLANYTDTYGSLNQDAIGNLCGLLFRKGLLTQQDLLELKNSIKQEWSTEDEQK